MASVLVASQEMLGALNNNTLTIKDFFSPYPGKHAICYLCKDRMTDDEVSLFVACCGVGHDLTCVPCWVSPHSQHTVIRVIFLYISDHIMKDVYWNIPNIHQLYFETRKLCPYLKNAIVETKPNLGGHATPLRFEFHYKVPGQIFAKLDAHIAGSIDKSVKYFQETLDGCWASLIKSAKWKIPSSTDFI